MDLAGNFIPDVISVQVSAFADRPAVAEAEAFVAVALAQLQHDGVLILGGAAGFLLLLASVIVLRWRRRSTVRDEEFMIKRGEEWEISHDEVTSAWIELESASAWTDYSQEGY